jgi:protein-tyrosine phosphatase
VTAVDAPLVPPQRLIDLGAVHNFRDLGGYTTADGRQVQWRRLFRADGLDRLTEADVEVLRPLGLHTVIDLRSQGEITDRGRFPFEAYPVAFHHLAVIDTTRQTDDPETRRVFMEAADDPSRAAEFLVNAYRHMLERGGSKLADGIRILGEPDALPAVFHCAAGKDRTGLFAALLLSGLGVSDEQVIEDYALSAGAFARTRAWAGENKPELVEWMDSVPAALHGAHPDAMKGVLDEIRASHGGARGFVAQYGVGDDVWDRVATALL